MFDDTNPNTSTQNNTQDPQNMTQETQDVTPTTPVQPEAKQDQQSAIPPTANAQPDQQQPGQQAQPVKPAEQPIKTTQEERMWAAIGYVAFLGVISLAMKPKSEFCRKHSAQGLILFIAWFVGLILLALPSIISVVGLVLMLLITALAILGIVKSIQSYEMNIPVLSALANKIPAEAIIGSVTGKTVEPTDKVGSTTPQTPPATPEDQNTPEPPTTPQQ